VIAVHIRRVGARPASEGWWPDAGGPLAGRTRPEELGAIYPHRWAIPRDVWKRFFASAEHEIGVLAYGALFLAEDAGLLGILADRASRGVRVRIALGDPDSPSVALRGKEEGIGDAVPAKVRNAIRLFRPLLASGNVESGCTRPRCTTRSTVLTVGSSSISTPTAYPQLMRRCSAFVGQRGGDMVPAYLDSFERVWTSAVQI
jgi:hypothetical protein